jgi:tetraacyldisaccharide-1-P 4'-kinase
VTTLIFSVVPSLKTIEEELEMKGLYVQRCEYPDHHRYSPEDIEFIEWMAQRFDLVITTEKDYMNLKGYDITMPFYILKSDVEIEPAGEFQSLIMGIIED